MTLPPAPRSAEFCPAEEGDHMNAELLRRLRDGADLNANPGQVAGWLCAGMFLRP